MGIGEHGAALLRREFIQVTLQEGEVPLDRGEWGAQLVRSIGDKATLGLCCAFQRGEHLIERLHHLHHFITSSGPWHALAQVAKTCRVLWRQQWTWPLLRVRTGGAARV